MMVATNEANEAAREQAELQEVGLEVMVDMEGEDVGIRQRS